MALDARFGGVIDGFQLGSQAQSQLGDGVGIEQLGAGDGRFVELNGLSMGPSLARQARRSRCVFDDEIVGLGADGVVSEASQVDGVCLP